MKRIACLSAFAIAALSIGAQATSTYKTIKATEAVRIESPAGTVPRLPYQLWVTYSDGTKEYRQVRWQTAAPAVEQKLMNHEVGKSYDVQG